MSPGVPPGGRPPPKSPLPPLNRAVALTSVPVSCAISRSTGPPGANCTTTKVTNMMPIMVGTMRRSRRRM